MARNASEPIAWKPRRLRKDELAARVAGRRFLGLLLYILS